MFDTEKIVSAVAEAVQSLEDLKHGFSNPELLNKIFQILKINRKSLKSKLRAKLTFDWSKNTNGLRDKIIERILCDSFSQTSVTPISSQANSAVKKKKSKVPGIITKKFGILLGVIRVPTWKILHRQSISSDLIHTMLRKKLPFSKIKCCLVFTGFKLHKTGTFRFVDYAYCRQPECECKYKFTGADRSGLTYIRIATEKRVKQKHTLPLSYQLRGAQRLEVRARLRHELPSRINADTYNKMDEDLAVNDGNYMYTRSLIVDQKARSEEMCQQDRHQDDTLDIIMRMQMTSPDEHEFIRRFVTPFIIYLGCQEQVDFLRKNRGTLFHFDATGSIIRAPYPNSKRVYLYAGSVRHEISVPTSETKDVSNALPEESLKKASSRIIVPLMHMISNRHDALTIRDCLIYFKELWQNAGIPFPPFCGVVVDWSWAGINAIMTAWNSCTVAKYLQDAFNEVTLGDTTNLLHIYMCYGHLMKMVSRNLEKMKIKGSAKSVLMEGVAVLAHSKSFVELQIRCTDFTTILLTKFLCQQVFSSMSRLSIEYRNLHISGITEEQVDLDNSKMSESEDILDQGSKNKSANPLKYASSPFFDAFGPLFRKAEVTGDNIGDEKNPFYAQVFSDYLEKRLMPFAPFWTGILKNEDSREHYTNATAENYFKQVKESVCENRIHAKAGRVIDAIYERVTAITRKVRINIPVQQTRRARKNDARETKDHCVYALAQNESIHGSQRNKLRSSSKTDQSESKLSIIEVDHSIPVSLSSTEKKMRTETLDQPDNMKATENWNRRTIPSIRKKYATRSTIKKIVKVNEDAYAHDNTKSHPLGKDNPQNHELRFNPNGTIANANYYHVLNPPRDYFVGIVPKSPADLHSYRYLREEDYNTLFGKNWITNVLIDYCFSFLIMDSPNKDRFAYLEEEVGTKFLVDEVEVINFNFKRRCAEEWRDVDGEPDLKVPDEDSFYKKFLRPCKWYAKPAFNLMKRFYHYRVTHPRICDGLLPVNERPILTSGIITPLPVRCLNGERVLLVESGKRWKPKEITLDQIFRGVMLALDAAIVEPKTQVSGCHVVLDMDGLTLTHVTYFTPSFAAAVLEWVQKCLPTRLKGVHIINQPFIFNMVFAIFKPFFQEKLRKRVIFHGTDRASLMKHIDAAALPKRYGGKLDIPAEPIGEPLWDYFCNFQEDFEVASHYGYVKKK